MADTISSEREAVQSQAGDQNSGNRSTALEQPLVLLMIVGSFLAVSTVIAKAGPSVGWHPLALLQWSILGGALGLYLITRFGAGRRNETVSRPEGGFRRLAIYLLMSGCCSSCPT
jgi:hypothetical protein